ncbi:DNA cytosine methyltransferase [Anaerosolibacter sp.]|uniref:DNA cytosine methyltransferase n=1 Tax=Anaerosolibacter sp. TaxID=1872527 RepID=UPI0039EE46DF
MKKLSTIDLFAGAGGLSYGFMKTRYFDIKVAVEHNKNAQATYKTNHHNVHIESDIRNIDYQKLKNTYGDFNVVIGGPPCQGFSNANRQKNELISSNNQLVKEYIRAVEELQPDVFVMENVKTMSSAKHKFFCTKNDEMVNDDLDIELRLETIPIASAVFQIEEFVNFLKTSIEVEKYTLSKENYSKLNAICKKTKSEDQFIKYLNKHESVVNKLIQIWDTLHSKFWSQEYQKMFIKTKRLLCEYLNGAKNFTTLKSNLEIIIELHKAMYKVQEILIYNVNLIDIINDEKDICVIVRTYNVLNFVTEKFKSLGYLIDKGIVNAAQFGVPQTRERFIIVGIKKSKLKAEKVEIPTPLLSNYYTIGDAIKDLAEYSTSTSVDIKPIEKKNKINLNPLHAHLNDSEWVANHIVTDTRDTALRRFEKLEPGQNFHDLDESLKTTYSDPRRTQNTIYQRLKYDQPSGTVLNARKSMWIHPTQNRAISIREVARLQSFPDSFIFSGPKDSQYQQIGNAVPPLLSRAIAEKVLELLGINLEDRLENIIIPRDSDNTISI